MRHYLVLLRHRCIIIKFYKIIKCTQVIQTVSIVDNKTDDRRSNDCKN